MMTEDERQAYIANHPDITPHESLIRWDIDADRLWAAISTSQFWWAYEAALIELQRDANERQRTEMAKRQTAATKRALYLVKR
jgi:hypothetical protein